MAITKKFFNYPILHLNFDKQSGWDIIALCPRNMFHDENDIFYNYNESNMLLDFKYHAITQNHPNYCIPNVYFCQNHQCIEYVCDFTTLENLNWLDKPPKEFETKYFLAKIDIKTNDKTLPPYYSVLLRIITETSKYIDQSILLEHWVLHSQYAFYILGTQSTFNSGIYTFKISGVYPMDEIMSFVQKEIPNSEFDIVLDD